MNEVIKNARTGQRLMIDSAGKWHLYNEIPKQVILGYDRKGRLVRAGHVILREGETIMNVVVEGKVEALA